MASLSKEPICIRLATLDDTNYLAQLKIESHHSIEKFDVVNLVLNDLFVGEYKKRWLRKCQEGMRTLILSVHDEKAGFISYTKDIDDENSAEINDIYLKPEIRGKQLGRMLCDAALQEIRQEQVQRVIVWLVDKRRQTRRFYEAMGFKATSSTREDILGENVVLRENQFEIIFNALDIKGVSF